MSTAAGAWPTWNVRSRLRMRHLEMLVALGEHASIHKVSRELNMSQPAASKLLREIERAFGVPLFERTRRGVAPNRYGEAVVERARVMLGILDGTRDTLAAIAGGLSGAVNVGVSAVAAPVLLPRALMLLRERGLGGRVRVEEGSAELLLGSLRRGALDCILGRLPEEGELADLSVEPLYEEPIVIAAGPDLPLARRRRIAWADAADCEWILPSPAAPLRRVLQAWFARLALPVPRCRFESVSILANVTAVRESQALVVMPGGVAEHYSRLGLVRVLPLSIESALPPVAVILRKGEPRTAALEAFLEAVRAAARGRTRRPPAI